MATGGPNSYSVVCHICTQPVQIYGGDFQSSWDLHNMKMHSKPEKVLRQPPRDFQNTSKKKNPRSIGNDCFTCPVCSERVELSNGNFNQCIQKHFETHNQSGTKPRSDDQLYTFDGIRNWIESSENVDKKSVNSDRPRNQQLRKSKLDGLPMGLRQHKGFLTENKDSVFCNICNVMIDSGNVHEHLKTKTHEDNVILCLKQKFPPHIQNMMEFVSFYGSNMCCNLCRCKIDLNSYNVHETIVNIVFHNSDVSHSSKRSNSDGSQNVQTDIGFSLLKSLASKHPQINDNKHLIKATVEPQFKCKWCDKSIAYSDKNHVLVQNFTTHFYSSVHKKSQSAFNVLKAFELMNVRSNENHRFVIANGNISCVPCKCKVEADINKLLFHMSGVSEPATGNSQQSSSSSKGSTNDFVKPQQKMTSDPGAKNWKSSEPFSKKEQNNANKTNKGKQKINIQELLLPLEMEFGKIKFIVCKGKDELTCLICECSIPPTIQNIKMHLTGNSHKKKVECELQQLGGSKPDPNTFSSSAIDRLFSSLPLNFQQDKKYIKDSPIEGYLICSLCNHVLNPYYLREHLEDAKHIVEKQAQSGLLQI